MNLEGPFLSPEKAGAQKKEYLRLPDKEIFGRLQRHAGGMIKLLTIAPEMPGAMEFVQAVGEKVRISLGHTATDYDTAMKAFAAGARHVTHFYNAMEPFIHR